MNYIITEKSISFPELYLLDKYAQKHRLIVCGWPPFVFALNMKLEVIGYYVEDKSGNY